MGVFSNLSLVSFTLKLLASMGLVRGFRGPAGSYWVFRGLSTGSPRGGIGSSCRPFGLDCFYFSDYDPGINP